MVQGSYGCEIPVVSLDHVTAFDQNALARETCSTLLCAIQTAFLSLRLQKEDPTCPSLTQSKAS